MIDLARFAGFPVLLDPQDLTLAFGPGIATAPVVVRHLAEVRSLLRDPSATGPDHLYTIYMDVRVPDRVEALRSLGLGYGAGMGAPGLWLGLSAGLTVTALYLLARFLAGTRPGLRTRSETPR